LSSGEAFSFLRIPQAAVINQSVFGIVIKGMHMGVPGFDFPLAAKVAWVYNVFVVGVAVWLGRRAKGDFGATTILAILGLGALRSPFVPQDYGPVIPQLLLLAVIAFGGQSRGRLIATIVAFFVVSIGLPPEAVQPNTLIPMMIVSSVPQILGYVVIGRAILEAGRSRSDAAAAV
jgi:hypothetical protein